MFIIDDVIAAVLDYFKQRLLADSNASRQALSHARKAMRKLAGSLSETVEYLDAGLHSLRRELENPSAFADELNKLVSQERLQQNCSESGVCEDLRIAQDELRHLTAEYTVEGEGEIIQKLIEEIDGYERQFVLAVREFLSAARGYDLLAINVARRFEPVEVLDSLTERVEDLRSKVAKIEDMVNSLRDKSRE